MTGTRPGRPALLAAGVLGGFALGLGGYLLPTATTATAAAPSGVVVEPSSGGAAPGGSPSPGPAAAGGPPTPGGPAPATTGSAVQSRVVANGPAIDTRYGTVQVQVVETGHRITSVTALALPSGGRSARISGYAAPILTQETLSAQNANIDAVSGASYTSAGWQSSLQGALDTARKNGA